MASDRRSDPMTFGDRLQRHRLAAGLTLEELAQWAGISARGINDLERGTRSHPYRETVRVLADALGLSGTDRATLVLAGRHPRRRATPRQAGGAISPFR